MKITTIKRALAICRAANITIFLWGHRGIGKSSLIDQSCAENQLGFIDFRISQIEASDLRGLPDKQNGRTVFLPPSEMPTAEITWEEGEKIMMVAHDFINDKATESDVDDVLKAFRSNDSRIHIKEVILKQNLLELRLKLQPRLKNGVIFLDETNRGQDDVLQALFQLVLDRRLGLYALPTGWSIVCAGNFNEGYQTNGFTDPAFLNRFCHITLSCDETNLPEWVDYMSSRFENSASKVIEFASQDLKHLRGDVKGELGFSIQPSPRSWELVARVLEVTASKDYGDDAKQAVIGGLIGKELALAFANYDCPVKPLQVIENGVKKMEGSLDKLSRQQIIGLTWGLAGILKRNVTDDKYGDVAIDYAKYLARNSNKDIAIAFCTLMMQSKSTNQDTQVIKSAMLSNPNVSKLLAKLTTGGKDFASRLTRDPELQNLTSKATWGNS